MTGYSPFFRSFGCQTQYIFFLAHQQQTELEKIDAGFFLQRIRAATLQQETQTPMVGRSTLAERM
jgi:hypothetical protein